MRPRVFPAEDSGQIKETKAQQGASMRPRVFPAEDARAGCSLSAMLFSRFNEAAGIPRGRLHEAHQIPVAFALLQ